MTVAEFSKLPLLTQTAYTRLLDLLLTSEAGSPTDSASLVSKTIGGRRYWYAQRRESGVGKVDRALLKCIDQMATR
jgi:hypothetical protein